MTELTKLQTAYLAGGCFWGMQELVRQIPGVLETEVGYTGGGTPNGYGEVAASDDKTHHARFPHPNPDETTSHSTKASKNDAQVAGYLPQAGEGTNESLRSLHFNATYQLVKTGRTGHAESLKIVFDPAILSYRHLLFEFFRMHNPTTRNRQGNDTGTQYRSVIFHLNDEQQRTALEVIKTADDSGELPGKIVTEVAPFGEFFRAEEYHQKYLVKHPGGYSCHYIRHLDLGETKK